MHTRISVSRVIETHTYAHFAHRDRAYTLENAGGFWHRIPV